MLFTTYKFGQCSTAVTNRQHLPYAKRNAGNRSPKPTVLSSEGIIRVWFLLHRGQFHLDPAAQASASLSTGILTVRGTPGQLAQVDRCVQVTIQDEAASTAWILTAE